MRHDLVHQQNQARDKTNALADIVILVAIIIKHIDSSIATNNINIIIVNHRRITKQQPPNSNSV